MKIDANKYPFVIKDDDGIRPAGKPDTCFYCNSKIGERHKYDCVSVVRKITIDVTYRLEVEVPNHWGMDDIDYKYNKGTHCSDNFLDIIGEREGCACDICHVEYIGEAINFEGLE